MEHLVWYLLGIVIIGGLIMFLRNLRYQRTGILDPEKDFDTCIYEDITSEPGCVNVELVEKTEIQPITSLAFGKGSRTIMSRPKSLWKPRSEPISIPRFTIVVETAGYIFTIQTEEASSQLLDKGIDRAIKTERDITIQCPISIPFCSYEQRLHATITTNLCTISFKKSEQCLYIYFFDIDKYNIRDITYVFKINNWICG